MGMIASDIVKVKLPVALLIMAVGGGVWRQYDWELVGIVAVGIGVALAISVLVEAVSRVERDIRELRLSQREHLDMLNSLQSDQVRRRTERHGAQ
jgi:hypothetical protein